MVSFHPPDRGRPSSGAFRPVLVRPLRVEPTGRRSVYLARHGSARRGAVSIRP